MTKISAFTAVTSVDDADELVLSVTGSPNVTRKVTAGNFRQRAYGEISANAASSAQGPFTASVWTKLTPFNANGVSLNTTPDHSNDKLTIANAGVYRLTAVITFTLDGAAQIDFAAYWNGSITQLRSSVDVAGASTVYQATVSGLVNVTSGSTDVELYAQMDDALSITVSDVTMHAERV